ILIIVAIAIGGGYAWYTGKKVAMTDMPQMIAMYNGMGGGAAATIAAVELLKAQGEIAAANASLVGEVINEVDPGLLTISGVMGVDTSLTAIVEANMGSFAVSGSVIAWAELDGRLHRSKLLPNPEVIILLLALVLDGFAVSVYFTDSLAPILIFFALALVLGV